LRPFVEKLFLKKMRTENSPQNRCRQLSNFSYRIHEEAFNFCTFQIFSMTCNLQSLRSRQLCRRFSGFFARQRGHSNYVCSNDVCSNVVCSNVVCSNVVCSNVVCSNVVCSNYVCSNYVCSNDIWSNDVSLNHVC
jgi:hypothetical protein